MTATDELLGLVEQRDEDDAALGSVRIIWFMLLACILWIVWMLASAGVFGGWLGSPGSPSLPRAAPVAAGGGPRPRSCPQSTTSLTAPLV